MYRGLSVVCHTLSGISVDTPAVSSNFTTSELPDLAAVRNAVIPFCMVEQLTHLFRISVAYGFLLLCAVAFSLPLW